MKRFSLLLASTLIMSCPAWAGELDAIVENCDGCHGDDGVSRWSDVPTIAGIDAFVHSDALYIYQEEARPCANSEYRTGDTSREPTNMCDIAAELDDDQIEAVSAFYADLPFVAAEQEFDAALATAGQTVHESNCGVCHTDGGSNPEDESSILAGQWAGYMRTTLADYRAGEREQPSKMQERLDALSDTDIEALVHFYASQQ